MHRHTSLQLQQQSTMITMKMMNLNLHYSVTSGGVAAAALEPAQL